MSICVFLFLCGGSAWCAKGEFEKGTTEGGGRNLGEGELDVISRANE